MTVDDRLGLSAAAPANVVAALSPEELAAFVIDGVVLLEGVVPDVVNRAALSELCEWRGDKNSFWSASETIRSVFATARVDGALRLLLGSSGYDHSSVHLTPAHFPFAQPWHQDSLVDVRSDAFDVLAFYFPAETPAEMGPTLVLPGSHLRRVSNRSLARHHGFRGQRLLACPGGSVALLHSGIWHCAQPNRTDRDRYMFKLRLRPGPDQPGAARASGRATLAVRERFRESEHPWQGTEAGVDQVGYARLWHYLGGEGDLSPEGYLTRVGLLPGGTAAHLGDERWT